MSLIKQAEIPVLSDEDEAFLRGLAEIENEPEVPEQRPPLPERPPSSVVVTEPESSNANGKAPPTETKKSRWSWLRKDSRDAKRTAQKAAADSLMSAASEVKSRDLAVMAEPESLPNSEVRKEEEEMSDVLEQLNLAAVNNRVFSLSTESQELLHKFTTVLKDIMNGVPTAYDDLESLLSNREEQLQSSYSRLPSWLQKLVEQLPPKMTKSLGPEVVAAGAAKAGLNLKVPSLKDLVGKPGALAGMLKAILNFLKVRFPAFMGLNVLYSLALFVLLIVLWYCHKRGREARLEQEQDHIQQHIDKLDEGASKKPAEPVDEAPNK